METRKAKNRGAEKKRGRILRAAEKEFARQGFAGARVDKIARAAGLDKATLYYYFRSKQDIYDTVLSEATRAFTEIASKGFERDMDPGEELAQLVDLIVDFLNKHRSFALILRICSFASFSGKSGRVFCLLFHASVIGVNGIFCER